MERAQQLVHGHLDALGLDYEVIDCDPAFADTAAFCDRYGYAPDICANCIVVVGKTDPPRYAACLVLATTRLDVNRTVKRLLGVRKASFATAAQTEALTGMTVGGVTVFGLPADLPVYVDAAVLQRDRVILGGGSRALKLLVASNGLCRLPNVEVVDGLATPA
jgi:prolyl-tRNA editing enzyme YbaK/EbsC (Cys-tRNA(Pro) deacylase)